MRPKAAITVNRPRDEVERRWEHDDAAAQALRDLGAEVRFAEAPGDRGTEIHVELTQRAPGGRVGELLHDVMATAPRARAKDELRRFKQRIETGEVPRSDAVPEGERVERKLKQRPAQPLDGRDRQEVAR